MHLGPPLRRWERRLIWLWTFASGAAVAGMALGVFWWWIVFILTIPFVFAAYYAPTLWLYFTPALLVWLALRRWPLAGVLAATAVVAMIAVGMPMLLNGLLAAKVRRAVASDRGKPVEIGAVGGAVAWLNGVDEYCSYECLRFLITGRAQAVLLGPALQGPPVPERSYLRIRLVPWSDDRGCPLPPDVKKYVSVPDLSLIDPDQCAAFDRVPLRTARLIFNQPKPSQQKDVRLPAIDVSLRRREVYGWQEGKPELLLRQTDVGAPKITIPLTLWPYNGADESTPAQWDSAGDEHRAGVRLPLDPITMVAEKMYVPAFDNPQ